MTSQAAWTERFTLVVPTYNRHDDLKRLLVLLERQAVRFRILVLDSSAPEVKARNAECARALSLAVSFAAFDPETPPFEKFAQGAAQVTTDFAALCADDDVVVPASLPAIVDFLSAHPDHSAAHGWYFAFNIGATIDIPRVVYRGASLDARAPLHRLHDCMRRYEALTYAVYRADVLKHALAQACRMATMMERELLGGALAAIRGKVARLPLFYYGRSLAPSHAYGNWHPMNFLAARPAAMFETYPRYREALIDALMAGGHRPGDTELASVVDLIHLRYLAEYARPQVLDELVAGRIAGRPESQLVQDALPLLVDGGGALERYARRTRWIRSVRNRVFPGLKLFHLKRLLAQAAIDSTTASGAPRRYRYAREFMAAIAEVPALQAAPAQLAQLLDGYE